MNQDYEKICSLMVEEELGLLEDAYEEYAAEMEDALENAVAKIRFAQHAIERSSAKRNLICDISWRVKEFISTVTKCDRKGYEFSIGSVKKNILDVGGIRIVTPFKDDVFAVAEIIRNILGIQVLDEKDYISNPKPNGYKSYHMHILIGLYSPVIKDVVFYPIEIQIRDKSMDFWATLEHILNYKQDASEEAQAKFKQIADALEPIDAITIGLRDNKKANIEADQGGSSSVLT